MKAQGKEIDQKSVIVVRYGATAGFVGRGYDGILANNLFEVAPKKTDISKEFLYLALKYGQFQNEVRKKAFGAAMPAISFAMIKDILVVVPEQKMQNKMVEFAEKVDGYKLTTKYGLSKLETLKQVLMQQYFG